MPFSERSGLFLNLEKNANISEMRVLKPTDFNIRAQ